MLTKLIIENFKKIDYAEIDLTPAVVFVGPNNSGKTSALQAISLWAIGTRRWSEHAQTALGKQRIKSITINRKELSSMPVPSALQIWNELRVKEKNGSKNELQKTSPYFQTSVVADSITNSYAREFGTTIFAFIGAKIDISDRIKAEINKNKNYR